MPRKKQQPDLADLEIIRAGKDEMNLVEYPFAALSWQSEPGAIIEHAWEARHPVTGRSVTATWRVEGSPQLGLPTAQDERVYLVLLELTREAGLSRDIHFTRYDILKRLNWPDNQSHYKKLMEGFRRLQGVNITSENAFWSPRAKSFLNVGFHIIENYEIVAEKAGRKSRHAAAPELPLSHFRWNETIWQSFQAGYIRSLDLGFALSLKLPLSLRLYRYLDKKAHDGRSRFEIGLRRLCELHLGMTPTRHKSTMKVRLAPAHQELLEKGFLHKVEYEPMQSRAEEKICYTFPRLNNVDIQAVIPTPIEQKGSLSPSFLQNMVDIGVEQRTAQELLNEYSAEQIELQLNCLSHRKPRDPAALFLYCLRKNVSPPASYFQVVEQQKQQEAERAASEQARQQASVAVAVARAQRQEQEESRALYESLGDNAKSVVRRRVEIELGEAGERFKIRYGHPQWFVTLCAVLQDPAFREQVQHTEEPDWTEVEMEDAAAPRPLLPNLDLYVSTLLELVDSSSVEIERLEDYREKYCPLLDQEEWATVKERVEKHNR